MNNSKELERMVQLKETDNIKRFGKFFRTKKGFYFYDTGTSKVIRLDEKTFDVAKKVIEAPDKVDIFDSEQKKLLDEFLGAVKDHNLFRAYKLERLGTIIHGEHLESQLGNNLHQIILEVTGVCNLRCGYCIYNETYDGNRNFNSSIMDKNVAFKAIDYLAVHGGDEVAVTFYGGEPLLQFDLVKECIAYAKKKILGKRLSFSLTTNLTLMTKERAEYFASVDGLSIVCSMDGPRDIHNSYRKYADGRGTFDRAFSGLKFLVDAYGDKAENNISINTVFAPPYTYEKLDEINEFFSSIEWLPKDIRIELTYVADGTVDDTDSIKKLMEDSRYLTEQNTFNPLFIWSKRQFSKGETNGISQSGINSMLLRVHKRNIYNEPIPLYPFNACCVPGARRLYVNTQGEFFVCERVGNSPNIGSVFGGVDIEKVRKHYINSYSEHSSKYCKNCWAIRMCDRCYVNNYDKDGYKNDHLGEKCKEMQDYVERELIYYHELLENAPEKLDYLNDINVV